MLACARIGVSHITIFAGTAATQLSQIIDECEPKLYITCSAILIDEEKIVKLVPILEEAIGKSTKGNKDAPRIIYQRPEKGGDNAETEAINDKYHDYKDMMEDDEVEEADPVTLPTTTELYIIYKYGIGANKP